MSAKNKDTKNRWRNKTIGFRVSLEEREQLEIAVKLSGLTKQDYITSRLLSREIIVQGNPRVYKALRDQLHEVLQKLNRIESVTDALNTELLETIQLITITLGGLKQEPNNEKSSYPAR